MVAEGRNDAGVSGEAEGSDGEVAQAGHGPRRGAGTYAGGVDDPGGASWCVGGGLNCGFVDWLRTGFGGVRPSLSWGCVGCIESGGGCFMWLLRLKVQPVFYQVTGVLPGRGGAVVL